MNEKFAGNSTLNHVGKRVDLDEAGEEIKIFIHRIMVRIGDEELKMRAGFAEREDIPYLLGRTDILACFNILFEEHRVVFIRK